jgi:hypothetical protein
VEFVERLGEFEIALELERRMLPDWMMRREKHAKAKSLAHGWNSCECIGIEWYAVTLTRRSRTCVDLSRGERRFSPRTS